MFSEDGHLVWAAQYRTWGGIKHIWKPDNDNEQFIYNTPPYSSKKGSLAFKSQPIETATTQDCPIRFQGQWEDAETGLYYNRFRYYDPLAGQYLSPDPIGLLGGARSNGYVSNPNTWIDPWGLACCKTGRDLFGEAKLKGLGIDRQLKDLTDTELKRLFEGSPYNLTNHALEQLKDNRLQGLGVFTPRDVQNLLNNGMITPGNRLGTLNIFRNGTAAVIDKNTKI